MNIINRRFKQMVAPWLLTKEEYWRYIQVKQSYFEANRSIARAQLIIGVLFSWVITFGVLASLMSVTVRLVIASILTVVAITWYVLGIYKKWWYGFFVLLALLIACYVWVFFLPEIQPLVQRLGLAYLIIGYLLLSHLFMLIRVKSIAVAVK